MLSSNRPGEETQRSNNIRFSRTDREDIYNRYDEHHSDSTKLMRFKDGFELLVRKQRHSIGSHLWKSQRCSSLRVDLDRIRQWGQRHAWLQWFRLRRRRPNSDEEIDEIHDLILNVYEAMDDQARAVLLSLSKVVQDEDESIAIEEKIRAIIGIGHTLCCGTYLRLTREWWEWIWFWTAHTQVKHATQLYTKLLARALSHADVRMRLAGMIAIAEASIDNLTFQMKVDLKANRSSQSFAVEWDRYPVNTGRSDEDVNAWGCSDTRWYQRTFETRRLVLLHHR